MRAEVGGNRAVAFTAHTVGRAVGKTQLTSLEGIILPICHLWTKM